MVLEKEMPDKDKKFIEMLNQYEKLAFSICYKMTGNYFDAEDMVQETFLSIYKLLGYRILSSTNDCTKIKTHNNAKIATILFPIIFKIFFIKPPIQFQY